MTDTLTKPKRGGDRRAAATANGKKVGAKSKVSEDGTVTISLRIPTGDDATLQAWADMETQQSVEGKVNKSDIVRRAVREWIIAQHIV